MQEKIYFALPFMVLLMPAPTNHLLLYNFPIFMATDLKGIHV